MRTIGENNISDTITEGKEGSEGSNHLNDSVEVLALPFRLNSVPQSGHR